MAEVFEATVHGAEGFARPVAIKRIASTMSRDPSFGQMFVNEARIASLLHHENIVSVLDFDRDDEGRYFLVMELVQGVDLRELAGSGTLPLSVIGYVTAEVLAGLAYAHDLEHQGRPIGIVHRDVSPHNVMVSWNGSVKLVDFGIAKAVSATGASRGGSLKGKLAYMSPEQAHGIDLDGRADLFAVGVMAHELVTGQRLFPGSTEAEVLARVLAQPIPGLRAARPDVPADFEAVVMALLERDRSQRPKDAQAAHDAVLATSVIDPRAQMQLRQLLRERFGDAPRRRAESEAASALTAASSGDDYTAVTPAPMASTSPERGGRVLMGQDTKTTVPQAAPPRRRRGLWIGLVGAALAAGGIASLVRGGTRPAAAVAPADAGVVAPTVAPPPEPVAVVPVEAPPDAAPPAPPAAPPDAGVERPASKPPRHRRPDAPATPHPSRPPAGVRTSKLLIRCSPWAQITLDGRPMGETPQEFHLPAGNYKIHLYNPELGKEYDQTVMIDPDNGDPPPIQVNWTRSQ